MGHSMLFIETETLHRKENTLMGLSKDFGRTITRTDSLRPRGITKREKRWVSGGSGIQMGRRVLVESSSKCSQRLARSSMIFWDKLVVPNTTWPA